MKLDSLETLLVEELRDLYNAERQILKALPKMAKAASSPNLEKGFQEHLHQTQTQVERLDKIFTDLGKSPKGKKCEAMEGLLKEGAELLEADAEPPVLDAALIAAAQRVEHYEIAGYGCARTYAKLLGHDEATKLLQQTLDEEKRTDEKLTELAVGSINTEAVDPEANPERKPSTQRRARV
jgi:ferritin-like metal-binding protein YciE